MVARVSQWFSIRNEVSDWLTNRQTERKNLVSLQWQSFDIVAHPLFMAVDTSVVGLQTVGVELIQRSRFVATDRFKFDKRVTPQLPGTAKMEDLWDMLATEEDKPICSESYGVPIGITVGMGIT